MKLKKIIYLILFFFLGVNICSAQSTSESYINWLQRNNAWEVLNNKFHSLPPSEENILTRANYLLRMNKPEKALNVLNKYGKFSSNSSEGNRLFFQAGIYRKNQEHYHALENYTSAAEFIGLEKFREKLQKEPNIGWYFQTIWKKYFWDNYTGEDLQNNLAAYSLKSAELASNVWPGKDFWKNVNQELKQVATDTAANSNTGQPGFKISSGTRNKTVQALLATAIGNSKEGKKLLQSVQQKEIKYLWNKTLAKIFDQTLLHQDDIDITNKEIKERYPKYRAFENYFYPVLENQSREIWLFQQPDNPSWNTFISRINSLGPEKALEKIQTELDSSLLNKNTENALKKYAFIYAVLAEDYPKAKNLWTAIEPRDKCLSLGIAGFILGYSSSFVPDELVDKVDYPYQNQLSLILKNSLHTHSWSNLRTRFWIREFRDDKSRTAKDFDLLFNYSLHRHQWSKNPSVELAKTIALLYPWSELKKQACIWLAKREHEKGNTKKAWEYLQEIKDSISLEKSRTDYLSAKAGLLMELGRKEKSLNTYKKLLANDPQAVSAEKKLNLALLSQKLDSWEWAQKTLLGLWENREELSTELQAETLFWLGEGAQNQGNKQKAKDYYFRLAWKYPGQHMWVLTALHRAAMICKSQGQLFTAKNILQKVQKEADKESQKKQAKKVLSRIEKQIREQQHRSGSLLY